MSCAAAWAFKKSDQMVALLSCLVALSSLTSCKSEIVVAFIGPNETPTSIIAASDSFGAPILATMQISSGNSQSAEVGTALSIL